MYSNLTGNQHSYSEGEEIKLNDLISCDKTLSISIPQKLNDPPNHNEHNNQPGSLQL